MNKSAMLEFEFLSKRFGLSASSVELHVRYNLYKVCIRHKLKNK